LALYKSFTYLLTYLLNSVAIKTWVKIVNYSQKFTPILLVMYIAVDVKLTSYLYCVLYKYVTHGWRDSLVVSVLD